MAKIKLIQENPIVGDISGNLLKAKEEVMKAEKKGIDLVIFSEMFLCGYPPEDLVLRLDFIKKIDDAIEELKELTSNISIVIGAPSKKNKDIYNSAYFLEKKELKLIYSKQILPNYKEFDERRYFRSGEENKIIELDGIKFGLSICEDIWSEDYVKNLVTDGSEVIINLSASPFTITKKTTREKMLSSYVSKYKVPIIYLNQVGGQDELVFDGASMIFSHTDAKTLKFKSFETDTREIEIIKNKKIELIFSEMPKKENEDLEDVYNALVLGTKDYVNKNGFNGIIIGSSGGIDSASTATIAYDALGSSRVNTVMIPFDFTAEMSI